MALLFGVPVLSACDQGAADPVLKDYMITYDNYYRINKEKDAVRYDIIVENVLDPMIRGMIGDPDADLKTADLAAAARNFLKGAGLSDAQIGKLTEKLTGTK